MNDINICLLRLLLNDQILWSNNKGLKNNSCGWNVFDNTDISVSSLAKPSKLNHFPNIIVLDNFLYYMFMKNVKNNNYMRKNSIKF